MVAVVDDHLIETAVSVLLAYGTYVLADVLHESGVIATVVAGMTLGSYGRRIGMSEKTREAIDTIWEFIAFLLTAIVFLLVGVAIEIGDLVAAAGPIAVGIIAVLVGRAVVTYLLAGRRRPAHPRPGQGAAARLAAYPVLVRAARRRGGRPRALAAGGYPTARLPPGPHLRDRAVHPDRPGRHDPLGGPARAHARYGPAGRAS